METKQKGGNQEQYWRTTQLNVQLGSSPVSSLGVVTDGVTSSQSDPLWQWSVLVLGLSQLLLDLERLLSLIITKKPSNNAKVHDKYGKPLK